MQLHILYALLTLRCSSANLLKYRSSIPNAVLYSNDFYKRFNEVQMKLSMKVNNQCGLSQSPVLCVWHLRAAITSNVDLIISNHFTINYHSINFENLLEILPLNPVLNNTSRSIKWNRNGVELIDGIAAMKLIRTSIKADEKANRK